jgi:hypothetical protein
LVDFIGGKPVILIVNNPELIVDATKHVGTAFRLAPKKWIKWEQGLELTNSQSQREAYIRQLQQFINMEAPCQSSDPNGQKVPESPPIPNGQTDSSGEPNETKDGVPTGEIKINPDEFGELPMGAVIVLTIFGVTIVLPTGYAILRRMARGLITQY